MEVNETDTHTHTQREKSKEKQIRLCPDSKYIQYCILENHRIHINTRVAMTGLFTFLCFVKQFSPFISKMKAFSVHIHTLHSHPHKYLI